MRRCLIWGLIVWWVAAAGFLAGRSARGSIDDSIGNSIDKQSMIRGLPLVFIPNVGQVDESVRFYAGAYRYTLWMTGDGLVFDSGWNGRDHASMEDGRDVSRLVFVKPGEGLRVRGIVGGSRMHYFKGNNVRRWYTGLETSKAVIYDGLFKKIDLKLYGASKEVAYDWTVHVGGDPARICFEYKDVFGTRVDPDGSLVIETKFGEMMHAAPVGFQVIDGKRINVPVAFEEKGNGRYGIKAGSYHKSFQLTVSSRVEVDATYFGAGSDELVEAMAVDGKGNIYLTGTSASVDFPLFNPYQSGRETFVSRISSSGDGGFKLDFCAVIGGRLPWTGDDHGYAIAVDAKGMIYVAGSTTSSDFPLVNAFQAKRRGVRDGFAMKLNPLGSGRGILLYSTYFGGFLGDEAYAVGCDGDGNMYITGATWSKNLPVHRGFQSKPGGRAAVYSDAFIAKLDPTAAGQAGLLYSGYIGGRYNDSGTHLAVDHKGDVYITGTTLGGEFPVKHGFQPRWAGNRGESYPDIFLVRVNTKKTWGESLIYSTYLGGMAADVDGGLAVDERRCAYITGYTRSNDFPARTAFQSRLDWGQDAFVTKIDTNRLDEYSLIYSTFLGGEGNREAGTGIAVNSQGHAFVTGHTESRGFPVMQPLSEASGAGCVDIFVTELNSTGNDLMFSTLLGAGKNCSSKGIGMDALGFIYIAGNRGSQFFPVREPHSSRSKGTSSFFTRVLSPGKTGGEGIGAMVEREEK